MEVGQPRSKWIRCSVKLKGEPFGSDQMGSERRRIRWNGCETRDAWWLPHVTTAFTLGVWKVTRYPATNSSQLQRKVLVFQTFSERCFSFGKIQELDLLRHVPMVNLRWVLSSHMTKSRSVHLSGDQNPGWIKGASTNWTKCLRHNCTKFTNELRSYFSVSCKRQ